jgi:DNA-binding transcriptional ArsR family regulator
MQLARATTAFAALSQETRLRTVRLLAEAGEAGMLSGEIGAALAVRPNTMSTNLGILLSAGLIRNRREGRTVRYFVEAGALRALAGYLETGLGDEASALEAMPVRRAGT